MKGRRLAVLAVGLVATAVGVMAGERVGATWRMAYDKATIPCLPYRLYAIQVAGAPAEPSRGDYVAFRTAGLAPFFEDGTLFTKQVLGVPGDRVIVTEEGARVGDRLLEFHPVPLQKLNRTRASLAQSYVLGPDQFFMAGTNPRAYDSRYYGPVHRGQLVGRSYPLW